MSKNFLGNDISWKWVMRKINTPLSVSSYPLGVARSVDVFGYPRGLSATWYDHGDIYFDKEEVAVIQSFLEYHIDGEPSYPDKIAQHVFDLAKHIDAHVLSSSRIASLSLSQLVELLRYEQRLFIEMLGFMSYRGSVQMGDILRNRVERIVRYRAGVSGVLDDCDGFIEQLSYAYYDSVIAEEKKHALRLSLGFDQLSDTDQNKRIQDYLNAYTWLSYHWFVGSPPTCETVHDRFCQLSVAAREELRRIEQERAESESLIRDVLECLGLSDSEQQLVRQYRTWLFLRTFVKDNINKAGYVLLPLLHAIADRAGLPHDDIVHLTIDEIYTISSFSRDELRSRIVDRKHGFSAGIVEGAFMFQEFEKPHEDTPVNTQQIFGSIAYKGLVRGVARVVMSPQDQHRLQKGEILVTSMTTPDYLPSMERASAFVTDEGGITCHAAIVAREMKKPCVTGTRNATNLIKDGDSIEVNAEKGVITIS